ncbi:hypothetical protein FHR24_000746 [Wenyingzhuangia heitensis]|uniref:TupA-like ATPgrasp n=1 Tax=Wenyingzhuangia heitensis TaxID=1487859 RepID=A0ABX0U685_9FLAO|nr:ATP-grasp fold amidoligase family protein [Wenyingzhuangia heitensis]NIJ44307.1 hypothetical protein [Wenyingzhuangia heitensis]
MFKSYIRKILSLIADTKLRKFIARTAYWCRTRIVSDKTYIEKMFKQKMGYDLDLKNPITLNEKLQWLKLYDRTELHTICADKLLVRDYVKKEIGEEYIIPLLFFTDNPEEITYDDLSTEPFIVKANNSSGEVLKFRNRDEVDLPSLKLKLKSWLGSNYYYYTKEWQYKNIKPFILFEKLLIEKSFIESIEDFKVHCFMSEPKIISTDIGRGTDNHIRNWYNTDWNLEPFNWSSNYEGVLRAKTDRNTVIKKPKNLDKMIEFSRLLAKPFKYVRIDWYEVNGHLFFGEITFHHASGFRPIEPKEYDEKFGDMVKL